MNHRGRIVGIALAPLLSMGATDDEERRRRERIARDREPKPVPIPDPVARSLLPIGEREYDEHRARIQGEIVGVLSGHPPEVQAMIDAEQAQHRARIIERNRIARSGAYGREDRRPVQHTAYQPRGQSDEAARQASDDAEAKRARKAAKRLKERES